ncbi:MAG: hypothetical protein AB1705_03435 [Verrucomicrobiota bacterium]
MRAWTIIMAVVWLTVVPALWAGVGDPQLRTDHPWYPGELAISTFERLFTTQAEQYERTVGARPITDEQKALAAWFWRNTHYAHGEEGAENYWGAGFTSSKDMRSREYWTGLFAHGFGLCGTTHSQWTAEFEQLLGHGRGRGAGVAGHNAFEVFLTGGAYGEGKWVLLDHDLSTVVFDSAGGALLSIPEIKADLKRLMDRSYLPQKQRGWLVCGLHPGDGSSYAEYNVAEYLPGYAGPPPMVHLRRGETLRRYFEPGLEDGKTFVFWGRNYNTAGIPGPERSLTWVNQPEKMHGSTTGAGYQAGRMRYANAVYSYRPDFANGDYREGAVAEDEQQVTFEFYTPYIIAATPANDKPWGIYDAGGQNGLVLRGKAECVVSVSVNQGRTWTECGTLHDGLDLTDRVKGHRQYWLRLGTGAKTLAKSGLTITTVCQANVAVLPRLKDGGTMVTFQQSGRGLVSAGPTIEQAKTRVVDGDFNTPRVTLELASPRGESITGIHAAAHVASGNPPDVKIRYHIDYSTDGGRTWQGLVKDWTVPRRGDEPKDFWSQSFCYGARELAQPVPGPVRIRFHNTGGKKYLRAEAHITYRVAGSDATRVTYHWQDEAGARQESHEFTPGGAANWKLSTGRNVRTRWVEMTVAESR